MIDADWIINYRNYAIIKQGNWDIGYGLKYVKIVVQVID